MDRRSLPMRGLTAGLIGVVVLALVALPALAADPSASPKPSKAPKSEKAPAVAVTATGTVGVRQDERGRPEYTLTDGTTVRVLSAGPAWFYRDDHPLQPYVGQRVTITGETEAGDDEIDVLAVDGTAIRAPGRPPWAGGWKRVGAIHPGWSQEKADRWAAKRFEQALRKGVACWPPGHCKDATTAEPTERPGGD